MTITSELNTLQTNLSNAYDAIEEKGGTLPANKNMNNLADSIANIPEANYTLMGNELRRAYCWTYNQPVQNVWKLYNPYYNVFSSLFEASTINGLKYNTTTSSYTSSIPSSGYVIIDGKLYSLNIASTYLTFTQQGTNTDWQDTNGTIFIRNNKAYNSYTYANNDTNVIVTGNNFILSDYGQNNYWFIVDGNLYYNSTLRDSGGWQYIYNWLGSGFYNIGLKNNKIYFIHDTKNILYSNIEYTFTNINLISHGATYFSYAINNKVYSCYFNYNAGAVQNTLSFEFSDNIKKLGTGYSTTTTESYIAILLENGDLYYLDQNSKQSTNNPVLKAQNIIEPINFCGTYFLDVNNNIYKYDGTLINTNFDGTFLYNGYFFAPAYYESTIEANNIYTIQYLNNITTAYNSIELPNLQYEVISKNNMSISTSTQTYTRNGIGDLVFTFVPEDLENHTFSDTDLLQAYLDAGIRQGSE